MGFCPCEPSGTSAELCRGRKGKGVGGGRLLRSSSGQKRGTPLQPPYSFRSPQYGHCPAVNNVATPAMWAALTMNQISFFSVKEV